MNTFGLIVFSLAVATASATAYLWEVEGTTAKGPTRNQLGSVFLHLNQGGLSGMFGMTKKIALQEIASHQMDAPQVLQPNHIMSMVIKTSDPVRSIKGVSFEWKKSLEDKSETQELSLSKVVFTPADHIHDEGRRRFAVSFCYDGPNVKPGKVVQMKSCTSPIFG